MTESIREQNKRLSLLFSETGAVYHEAALKLGLTDSTMDVLYTICQSDGVCPLGKITALSGMPKQTVNSALRKLERGGMLYLEPAGGRKKQACLTEKGRELCGRTVLRLMGIEDGILENWLPGEREQYLALTRRYLEALREKVREL